jgi:hypothetical protein
VLIEFQANAFDLHRACVRLASKLGEMPEHGVESSRFNVVPGILRIAVDGASANLQADVMSSGAASVPFTVLAGVVHMLPYFGKKAVEIGFSDGKMRVDTTVFHNRAILLSSSGATEHRRSSLKYRALQAT